MNDKKNEKLLTVHGLITEALPNTLFRVEVGEVKTYTGERKILAYLSGKMRMHRIKVLVGDSVEVVLDEYGGKGRIIKRL